MWRMAEPACHTLADQKPFPCHWGFYISCTLVVYQIPFVLYRMTSCRMAMTPRIPRAIQIPGSQWSRTKLNLQVSPLDKTTRRPCRWLSKDQAAALAKNISVAVFTRAATVRVNQSTHLDVGGRGFPCPGSTFLSADTLWAGFSSPVHVLWKDAAVCFVCETCISSSKRLCYACLCYSEALNRSEIMPRKDCPKHWNLECQYPRQSGLFLHISYNMR